MIDHSFVHAFASSLESFGKPHAFPIGKDHFAIVSRSEMLQPLVWYFLQRAFDPRFPESTIASIADFPDLIACVRWSLTNAEVPLTASSKVAMKACGAKLVPKFRNFQSCGHVG